MLGRISLHWCMSSCCDASLLAPPPTYLSTEKLFAAASLISLRAFSGVQSVAVLLDTISIVRAAPWRLLGALYQLGYRSSLTLGTTAPRPGLDLITKAADDCTPAGLARASGLRSLCAACIHPCQIGWVMVSIT